MFMMCNCSLIEIIRISSLSFREKTTQNRNGSVSVVRDQAPNIVFPKILRTITFEEKIFQTKIIRRKILQKNLYSIFFCFL